MHQHPTTPPPLKYCLLLCLICAYQGLTSLFKSKPDSSKDRLPFAQSESDLESLIPAAVPIFTLVRQGFRSPFQLPSRTTGCSSRPVQYHLRQTQIIPVHLQLAGWTYVWGLQLTSLSPATHSLHLIICRFLPLHHRRVSAFRLALMLNKHRHPYPPLSSAAPPNQVT